MTLTPNTSCEWQWRFSLVSLAEYYGMAVEVHADGPASIPSTTRDEDKFHTGRTDVQKSITQPTKVKLRRPRGTRPSGHIAAVGVSGPPFPDLGM